ncbi:hypothetical protein [Methanobrevibacter sp. YE315]|uniref:hypothetical protein n=1 Tax=Methanobrevibacter sp. YE315 TaxID=1609968 RepID=UPI0012DC0E02|nr:hypothetical protein [Methanobrevibacter sp. YE315]
MGFYSANTPEQKRIKKLTGDINIHDMFKNECKIRGIAIYNAYNIQKRLIHEVEEEQLVGVDKVDERLMELLDEKGKIEVQHRYVDFVSNEDSASRGVIPPRSDGGASLPQNQINMTPKEEEKTPSPQKETEEEKVMPLPPKDQIKIPPRARDGKKFYTDDELPDRELLKKIMLQNKKIINQNKIIIEQLKKLGEKDD